MAGARKRSGRGRGGGECKGVGGAVFSNVVPYALRAVHVQESPHKWPQPEAVDGGPWIRMDPRPLLDQADDSCQTREQ